MVRTICLFLILLFTFATSVWGQGERYAKNSVLSEGRWVKIKVDDTGIYKLTAADVKKMGFSDISKVGVYGYGGWMINETFTESNYTDDLPEVATWKGNGDFILFYGKGNIRWDYTNFRHERNPYSETGYYFLHETDNPRRMESVANLTEASLKITTFDDFMLHELESVSIIGSGRDLFGESFKTKTSQDFTFNVPGITNDEGKIHMRFVAKAAGSSGRVSLTVGDDTSSEEIKISSDTYEGAKEANINKTWTGTKSETTRLNVAYAGISTHTNIYLDYLRIQMKRELRPYGAVTLFRNLRSANNDSRFVIQNGTSDMLVFDVTDGEKPQLIETSLSGTELSFTRAASSLREYALVNPNGSISTPEYVSEVKNQNLHALTQTDMVIIAPQAFSVQAERLAEEHRKRDNLTVHVVNPNDIYNEFSSGTPDASAYRRFMKMFYDRSTSETDAPNYLLLFGDGAYDNRQLTADWKKVDMSNFLLTYQSVGSIFSYINSGSYVTDDYFGLLKEGEGSSISTAKLNLGIGRFPVRTVAQAKNAVDKVIAYMDNTEHESWKNTVTFVADDGNSADGFTIRHMEQADGLAKLLLSMNPEIMVKKLYFDDHKKISSSGGFATYPTIKTGLQQQLKDGTLILNYTGHGSKDSWSDEKILVQADVNQFSYTKLPLWITATCDFTPFDAIQTSAGEDVFLNAKSGGIALFTTMRVAYEESNTEINQKLYEALFQRESGVYPTLGQAIMNMKNSITKYPHQKLNFTLIGDPALRLNYPTDGIQITEVNGEAVSTDMVTFKALEKITIKGEVLKQDGSRNTDFNGEVNPTVFDSQVTKTTLDNNGTGKTFTFNDFPNKLFVGNADVKNGEFEFTFTVPIDISYSNNTGKMSLYAVDPTTGLEAAGSFHQYTVGGTGGSVEDMDGPEIRALYLNDSTFVDGGMVNSTPLLAVRLWDATGVNVTGSSIGHDITLVIDGQSTLTYNLNPYYKTISGTDGEGLIHFLMPELSAGMHSAELKVWDVLNNSTTETFTFEVGEGLKPKLYDLRAAPSPARENVTFYLYHNRPESTVKVTIMVYDMTGRLQWRGETQGTSGYEAPLTMQWDLTNGAGSRLRPGIYIYRAMISANNSKEVTGANKLILLAQ